MFHLKNIHADANDFAGILNQHTKPGRKSRQEEHIERAKEVISAAGG